MSGGRGDRGGYALLAVLLVLLALLVLCAPFLLTARKADRSSARLADAREAELALDAAGRHARAVLASSHPSVDETPYWDSAEELAVDNRFPDGFLDASDPRGAMWDVESEDLSGRIDLNSAPPQMLANAMGRASFLTRPVAADDPLLPVADPLGFPPEGWLWVDGEHVRYAAVEGGGFLVRDRGLGARVDADGAPASCGPRPAGALRAGAPVLDLLAWSVAEWRRTGPGATLRALSDVRDLRELDVVPPFARLDEAGLRALEATGTVWAGIAAGDLWQRPARLVTDVVGGVDCNLVVDQGRWFNPGTTVRIEDGRTTELALVVTSRDGRLRLAEALVNDYPAYEAVVRPLARRPVNVNTASPAVLRALVLNLKLDGVNERITGPEADELVRVIATSRPFAGFEDFLRRVVLPAAGLAPLPEDAPVVPEVFARRGLAEPEPFLDREDAVALYRNALNANDAGLEFSTLPFAFTSREVHDLELRAAINAPSGVQRLGRVRREVDLLAPQGELLRLWIRQEDFDEALRLGRDAPYWSTGPNATSVWDAGYGTTPPPRAAAHFGDLLAQRAQGVDPVQIFASREEDGFAQLWPARVDERGVPGANGALHFDLEVTDPEGRYLPAEPVVLDPAAGLVGWTRSGLVAPLSLSLWVEPRGLLSGQLLDLGAGIPDADRLSLLVEGSNLVLRVLDGAGDHNATAFQERAEVKVPLTAFPPSTWTHVSIDVRGNQPDQMTVLVDGMARGETPGLTRLTQAVGFASSFLPVDSTDGFPDRCVLRVGDELIEAVKQGGGFSAVPGTTGQSAGFGGRMARERFTPQGTSYPDLATNSAFTADPSYADHAAGTAVSLYGYSLPVISNVPSVEAQLPAALGRFAVARAIGVDGFGPKDKGESIAASITDLQTGEVGQVVLGHGLEAVAAPTLLLGVPGSETATLQEVMAAFNPGGGYALLATRDYDLRVAGQTVGTKTLGGELLTGTEVIHYTGWSGNRLFVDRRGDAIPELALPGASRRASVFHWSGSWTAGGSAAADRLSWQTFVVPISIPAPGGGGPFGFAAAPSVHSELAQLTRLGAESHLTEWVRYDEVAGDQLVRSDAGALEDAREAALAGQAMGTVNHPGPSGPPVITPPGPGTPGGNPGGANPGGSLPPGSSSGGPGASAAPPPAPSFAKVAPPGAASPLGPPGSQVGTSSAWHFELGTHEEAAPTSSRPLTSAVETHFQFRGVMGTYSHAHPAGTPVLPVWRAKPAPLDVWDGRPGRHDPVMLFDAGAASPGWPGEVQHAHQPQPYTVTSWRESGSLDGVLDTIDTAAPQGIVANATYVALKQRVPIPIAPNPVAVASSGSSGASLDDRTEARITMFPSGELPRLATALAIGGEHTGGAAAVPSAVVDEIVFGASTIALGGTLSPSAATLRLEADAGVLDGSLFLTPDALRIPSGTVGGGQALGLLPADAGLLRIGEELVFYDFLDVTTGNLRVGANGRGVLGSTPSAHSAGEGVHFLEHHAVTVLAARVAETEAALPVADASDFPDEGTVLIGQELVHYTRRRGNVLEMPRASTEPGARDEEGAGLFRGRFGTAPASHDVGEMVLLFPFRYWDRFEVRADAPELAYLGLALDQPGAYWSGLFWNVEEALHPGVRLGVLQRSDPSVPWDAPPRRMGDSEPRGARDALRRYDDEERPDGTHPIGLQADRLEWRLFAEYEAGAFDPLGGAAHGWKCTPRLRLFGVELLAPSRTYLAAER